MKNTTTNLTVIRKKINSIDDSLKRVLQRRSILIPKVKTIKSSWDYRVSFKREYEIAKKIKYSKFGFYNKGYMQKIWREIISATLNIECDLTIGIYGQKHNISKDTFTRWEITKEHFGSCSKYALDNNINTLFEKLLNKKLDVIVLPYFNKSEKWWFYLKDPYFRNVKINIILPNIKAFRTLYNEPSVCLSLNSKEILKNKYYICTKIIEYTIDTHNNLYLIETILSKEELKLKYKLTDEQVIFIGSSPCLV